jgi:hypothetical protein
MIQVYLNTVKKYLTKMRVHRKAKIRTLNHSTSTIRHQNYVKAVMEDESYFTVAGIEWQQQSYYGSEDHPTTEDVKFICKTKFLAKVFLWLAVSESGISEPKPVL